MERRIAGEGWTEKRNWVGAYSSCVAELQKNKKIRQVMMMMIIIINITK